MSEASTTTWLLTVSLLGATALSLIAFASFLVSFISICFCELRFFDRDTEDESPATRRFWALRDIERSDFLGVRPRDWATASVTALTHDVEIRYVARNWKASQQGIGTVYAGIHALDSGDIDHAARLFSQAVGHFSFSHLTSDHNDAVLWVAVAEGRRGNAEAARRSLDRCRNDQLTGAHLYLLAQSATLLAEGQHDAAASAASLALSHLPDAIDLGIAQMQSDLLSSIISEARAAGAAIDSGETDTALAIVRPLLDDESNRRRSTGAAISSTSRRIQRLVPRAALLGMLALLLIATPIYTGTWVGRQLESEGSIFQPAAQLGQGTNPEYVAALLSSDDLGPGWVSVRPERVGRHLDEYVDGSAVPCTGGALFAEGAVWHHALGNLTFRGNRQYIDQAVYQTTPANAEAALRLVRANRDCGFWTETADGDWWVEPMAVGNIGDDSVAYWLSYYEYDTAVLYEANVIVTRTDGAVIELIHWQEEFLPDLAMTESIARQAVEKVSPLARSAAENPPTDVATHPPVAEASGILLPITFLLIPFGLVYLLYLVNIVAELLSAVLLGLRVRAVVFLPFIVTRTEQGWRVRTRFAQPGRITNGLAFASAVDGLDDTTVCRMIDQRNRQRHAVMVVVAVASALIAFLTNAPAGMGLAWHVFWVLFAVIVAAEVITTARKNARVRGGMAGGPATPQECAAIRIGWQAVNGVRPRDWNTTDIATLATSDPERHGVRAGHHQVLVHYHAWDCGDIEAARAAIRHATAITDITSRKSEPTIQSIIFLAAASFTAHVERDAAAARGWLSRVQHEPADRYEFLLAEADVLIAEGAPDRALQRIELGLAASAVPIEPGLAQFHRDRLQTILDDIVQTSRDGIQPLPAD